jgi:hypothetical protein
MKETSCWKCQTHLNETDYGRRNSCPKCDSDTHVCKNCGFHDTNYNNQCREPSADRVVDKEKSNFCDYFIPTQASGSINSSKDDLRSAAEALFKKK